jgi:ADP-ribose pyrophosphatase YjhB (NUDIX family)
VVLKRWLQPDLEDKVPPLATHQIGTAGFVLNAQNELLVIKEWVESPDPAVPRVPSESWKLPGGMLDKGESFGEGCCREVWEETGVDCDFESLLCFWHRHNASPPFLRSDLYVVCLLTPTEGDKSTDNIGSVVGSNGSLPSSDGEGTKSQGGGSGGSGASDPKYAMMQKMGMPEGAIRQQMTTDGWSPADQEAFFTGGGAAHPMPFEPPSPMSDNAEVLHRPLLCVDGGEISDCAWIPLHEFLADHRHPLIDAVCENLFENASVESNAGPRRPSHVIREGT